MRAVDITTEVRRLDELAPRILTVAAGLGVVGVIGAVVSAWLIEGGFARLLETYLVSFAFFLSLSLGALFFVLLHHATRAGWSVVIRRVAEGLAANVTLCALLALPVLLGMGHLYHWSHADAVAHDPILAGKAGYLDPAFFVLRVIVYFAIWIVLARVFFRGSVAQDRTGDPALTRRLEKLAGPGLVLFALSLNFAAFDLLMSLDPHWFSTIFGVYYFGSSVVVFFAVMPILLTWLQSKGRLVRAVTVEHYHDLGKFLFAFIVFWAYIAFSQYMLIWYGNLPEETGWFLKRQTGEWVWVSLALLFGHFVLPFLALVSRFLKRRPLLLAAAGGWMVLMHWVDLYWLVMPEFSRAEVPIGPVDLFCFLALAGAYLAGLAGVLRRHSLVPERDPRLVESLAFETA